jgi:hypothetical protein
VVKRTRLGIRLYYIACLVIHLNTMIHITADFFIKMMCITNAPPFINGSAFISSLSGAILHFCLTSVSITVWLHKLHLKNSVDPVTEGVITCTKRASCTVKILLQLIVREVEAKYI